MPSILNATTTNGLVTSADNSGSLQLQTNNGTTAVTIDTSQNVGIGTTSPAYKLDVSGGHAQIRGAQALFFGNSANNSLTGIYNAGSSGSSAMAFETPAGSERMRIDSGGNLLVGGTSNVGPGTGRIAITSPDMLNTVAGLGVKNNANNTGGSFAFWVNSSNSIIGTISQNSSTSVGYNTSSDYRLKDNVQPMTGALAKVAQLKPVTFTWNTDNTEGQGFIAHELQEVCPDAVNGTKDAVDADGNPVYQGVDTSFLVATLTAAIQELKAELDATKAEVQALKGVA